MTLLTSEDLGKCFTKSVCFPLHMQVRHLLGSVQWHRGQPEPPTLCALQCHASSIAGHLTHVRFVLDYKLMYVWCALWQEGKVDIAVFMSP